MRWLLITSLGRLSQSLWNKHETPITCHGFGVRSPPELENTLNSYSGNSASRPLLILFNSGSPLVTMSSIAPTLLARLYDVDVLHLLPSLALGFRKAFAQGSMQLSQA